MKKLLLVLSVVAMASLLFTGCLPTTNTPPVITTTALLNGEVGTAYTDTVVATDVDVDDVLVFSLTSGPTDMVISEAGVISGWTPAAVGTEAVTVAVTDGTDSVSADYTITVEAAPIINTAPVLAAIADQEVKLGETFTYSVVATDAEADTLTYSVTGPLLMSIDAAGVITYSPEFATQLGPHAVAVEVSDGVLVDTEDFVLTVVEADPLVIDIDVPGAYIHPTKGPIVAADCYDVVVTFSDNSATEGQDVWVRWNEVGVAVGEWVAFTGNVDDTEFTGEICFDATSVDCALICIEVKVGTICCDPIIYSEMLRVDFVAPCASFTVCVEDCDPCTEGAEMSWFTTCEDICDLGYDCCDDYCSGVADWSFVLDDEECEDPCDTETGTDCSINGAFECGCLSYDDPLTENVNEGIHVVEVSIFDNVGNEFTDTWTLTFDTDSLVGIDAPGATVTEIDGVCDWDYYLDYGCDWSDCAQCEPEVAD